MERKMAVKNEVNPAEELVEISIPRKDVNDKSMFVGVNGRTWLLQKGVRIKIPRYVYDVIRTMEDMQEKNYEFISKTSNG